MSDFPNNFDDDTTLPFVNDNITEIGGDAINALRDAVFNIEQNIGLGAAGSTTSIAARFGISFFPDGTLKPSAITSLGLVTLPITQDQIAEAAGIPESKLKLDHRTQDLFNYIRDLSGDINKAIGWISVSGIKLEPHLIGAIYRHTMNQVDVSGDTLTYPYLDNKFRQLRDNLQSYNLVADINQELLAHQWADGSPFALPTPIITNNGSQYPAIYAHVASGIYLNTDRFSTIPQTAQDLQAFAEFVDSSSIFLLGSRIQNLYSTGISRVSRSSSLSLDGYGSSIVPSTPAIAYLKNIGNTNNPFDDINTGDDIIEFKPTTADQDNNVFDAKFNLVKVGDIVRVNYGSLEVPFLIKEKKYIQNGGNKKYLVRIAGKNLEYSANAVARIDKPLVNANKYGVLAIAAANNTFSQTPSLIVSSPRGGQALGVGFSPQQLDESHYLLYLAIYPTGSPQDGYTILPGIDVTGNVGTTPGLYTLDSVVEATNAAFRKSGFNYRFIAFSYEGEFGIALADSYGNCAFSILSACVDPDGSLDQTATSLNFPNNVVDLFPDAGTSLIDSLGLGPTGANLASPPFMPTYGSAEAASMPTKLFMPLRRNNYYVNGIEKDRHTLEVGQALDGYGDGYWVGTIVDVQTFPGPNGRVQVTYRIPLDLSASTLKIGKTLVVQSITTGSLVDFGRFVIQSVNFGCNPTNYTDVTVYDAVHAQGFSPTTTLAVGNTVAIYFNSDSVSFNAESATDFASVTPFKRHFEVYIDENASTFTHERGRFLLNGNAVVNDNTLQSSTEIAKLDIIKISPKLRGFSFGSVTKITLYIIDYSATTGIYSGYLASFDGITLSRQGPTITGKKGEVTRFYDETNIDYIDVMFDVNASVSSFVNTVLDIQLFPTLSLDDEIMLIGTCQLNDVTKAITRIRDERSFGNIAEKDLSSSALDYISYAEKALHFNGVVRGLDIVDVDDEKLSLRGGVVLVNGKFHFINEEVFVVPRVRETYLSINYPVNWILCVNSGGDLVIIPLLDYDSVLGTPSVPTRLFTANNVVSATSYTLEAITFSNLINLRKDLTPLYRIAATVSGSGPSATISLAHTDIRRFINDQDSSIPAVVTPGSAQGNFKTINSAVEWLRYNNSYQDTLALKGTNSFTGAFSFPGKMHILAQANGTTVDFASTFNGTNFRFTDIPVTISGTTTLSNSIVENGTFTTGAACTLSSVQFNKCSAMTFGGTVTATNSSFGDGSMVVSGAATLSNSFFNGTTLNTSGNFTLTNSSFNGTQLTVGGNVVCTGSNLNNFSSTITGSITASDSTINRWIGTAPGTLTLTNVNILGRYNSGISVGATTISGGAIKEFTILSSGNLTTTSSGVNAVFENSFISASGAATLAYSTFINCSLYVTGATTITNCTFENCQVTFGGISNISNSSFVKTTMDLGTTGNWSNVSVDGSSFLQIKGTLDVYNVAVTNSNIVVTTTKAFSLNDNSVAPVKWASINNFRFTGNYIEWNSPTPSGTYSGTSLVNASNGFFHRAVLDGEAFEDVIIEDNKFVYSAQDHFPIFALQLTGFSSVARNISVSRNVFTSTAGIDDVRAIIVANSTVETLAPINSFPKFPALIDVHFDENICNYNQMIMISGPRVASTGGMSGSYPVVTDTSISKNVCGTIAYFISSSGPYDGNNVGNPNQGVIRDKTNKLVISNNHCKFISNLDGTSGKYIAFRATRFPSNNFYEEVSSTIGETVIEKNHCNWIQVGAGGYTIAQSGVHIVENTVSPANPNFLDNFTSSTIYQSVKPANVGILLRRPHNAIDSSSSTISGNHIVQKYSSNASTGVNISGTTGLGVSPIVITTSTAHGFADGQIVSISSVTGNSAANGTWIVDSLSSNTFSLNGSTGNGGYTGGGVAVSINTWYYDAGLVCFNHAIITNNIIAGVVNGLTSPIMYFWDINSQIVTGNVLERRGLSVNAYFFLDGLSGDGTAAQKLIITNNTMDAADAGSGFVNRLYIKQNPSGTAAYGTGSSLTGHQSGWRANSNIAGVPGTYVYV